MSERIDLYTRITSEIVEQLEQGVRPRHQPLNAANAAGPVSRPLRHNGTPYSGVNVLILWVSSHLRGYTAPLWMTFNQAKELGGHVRKGEKSSPVVYANSLIKTDTDPTTGCEVMIY